MKINTSYEIRGARFGTQVSIPEPTVENLTKVIQTLAWTARQACPEVEVILDESEV